MLHASIISKKAKRGAFLVLIILVGSSGYRTYYLSNYTDLPILPALWRGFVDTLYGLLSLCGAIIFVFVAPLLSISYSWPTTIPAIVALAASIVFAVRGLRKAEPRIPQFNVAILTIITLLWLVYGAYCAAHYIVA
jgi:hypothetical protein